MGKPNNFESILIEAAKVAHNSYIEMSDGYWLDHAHEAFLSTNIAQFLHKEQNYKVFMDASLERIRNEQGSVKGRKSQQKTNDPPHLCMGKIK